MSVMRTMSNIINDNIQDMIHLRTMLRDAFRYTKKSAPNWFDMRAVRNHTIQPEVFRLQWPLLYLWLLLGA